MKSALTLAKQDLVERAIQMYTDRRTEIDFIDYPKHFDSMGSVISDIDQIKSFPELVKQLEEGKFEVLGLFPSDEDMMTEFLKGIFFNKMNLIFKIGRAHV